ncbi:MAG: GAF domain-containing protein [Vicinamibacteria bacterium]
MDARDEDQAADSDLPPPGGPTSSFAPPTLDRPVSRELLLRFADTAANGLGIADLSGRLIYANPALCAMIEAARPSEVVGEPVARFLEPESGRQFESAVIPELLREGRVHAEAALVGLRGHRRPAQHELFTIAGADGRPECLANIVTDISERLKTEDLLRTRLRIADLAGTATLDDLIQIALDAAERLTDSSIGFFHLVDEDQQALTLQTWSTRTLAGMCTAEGKGSHYPIAEAGVWADCVRRGMPVVHNDYASLEGRHGLPAGHAVVTREATVPVVRDGAVVAIMGVGNKPRDYTAADVGVIDELLSNVVDLIERKRAQDALRALNAQLEDRVRSRTAALQEANAELEAFSYSVSHDLRAPLRVVDGYSRMLQELLPGENGSEVGRLLAGLRGEASRMGRLIEDLLRLSRASRSALHPVPTDMAALARAAFEPLRVETADAGRTVELSVGPLPPAEIDPSLLRQVWTNLLSNAVKFTRGRDPAHVRVDGWEEGEDRVYRVSDDGVGFDPRCAGRLFGAFQRLHRQDEFEGTGVGLALVQRIVARHGGRTWAESEPGRGASFSFRLPANAGLLS